MTNEEKDLSAAGYRAWLDGKPVEVESAIQYSGRPTKWIEPTCGAEELFLTKSLRLRPRPEPRLRPWKLSEVPLDAWFRWGKAGAAHRIAAFFELGTFRIDGNQYNSLHLFEHCEHSLTGRDPWSPCGILEDTP